MALCEWQLNNQTDFDGYVNHFRPHIEYAVQAWSHFVKDIECLKSPELTSNQIGEVSEE